MKIELKVKSTKDKIICSDLRTLQIVIGSTAVVGNFNYYGVTKKGNVFEIPKKTLAKRLETLRTRRDKLNDSIAIIAELLDV